MAHLLSGGPAAPHEVARDLKLELGVASYHLTLLKDAGILELARRSRRPGYVIHFYRIASTQRDRVAARLWGLRATLLHTDQLLADAADANAGGPTLELDTAGLREFRTLTTTYLSQLGRLARDAQTRIEDPRSGSPEVELTAVALLLATEPVPLRSR